MSETRPRVLATRRYPPEIEARLEREFQATLNETDRILSPDELVASCREHDAVLCCPSERFSREVLEQVTGSIGIVATLSVGYEHIDVPAARDVGIVVTYTPDVLTDATADTAMLCILAAARRGAECDRFVRSGRWDRWHTMLMLGIHVSGKRLGILGMGRIGRALARRARGFDMEVHYHNRRRLPADQEQGATFHADPAELLAVSDFFSINCPSTPETVKFLDAERIEMLPAGAIVVNTARGNIVDDEALVAALRSGRVAAAGLDVFDNEPNLHPGYLDLENAFLLPHVGSATHETRMAMGATCLDNLAAFFAGRPCPQALT
ncbi:MAG: D-glycerate dehydrogenase [Immundisolibacterales bacterium]|nr:D-glycerate dehydrogenase [Immundisolibacterales bacterium]